MHSTLKEINSVHSTLKEINSVHSTLKEINSVHSILKEIKSVHSILKEINSVHSTLKEIIILFYPEGNYLFAHFLGLEIANLFGRIDGNVNCLVVTHRFSGHKFAWI